MMRKRTVFIIILASIVAVLMICLFSYSPIRFATNFVKQMYSVTYENYHHSIAYQRALYDDKFSAYAEQNYHDNGEWIITEKASYHLLTPIKTSYKVFDIWRPVMLCSFELLIDDEQGNILFSGNVIVQVNLVKTGFLSYMISFIK